MILFIFWIIGAYWAGYAFWPLVDDFSTTQYWIHCSLWPWFAVAAALMEFDSWRATWAEHRRLESERYAAWEEAQWWNTPGGPKPL